MRSTAFFYLFFLNETTISLFSPGKLGAPFINYDVWDMTYDSNNIKPRPYAVEGGKQITDVVSIDRYISSYNYRLLGPNGFMREFIGNTRQAASRGVSCSAPQVHLEYDTQNSSIILVVQRSAGDLSLVPFKLNIYSNHYRYESGFITNGEVIVGGAGSPVQYISFNISGSGRWWYDFSVHLRAPGYGETGCYFRRFAGTLF